MWTGLEIALLVAAVTWDITSLVLSLRRNLRGKGASGVPVISWLIYVLLVEWRNQPFFFETTRQAGVVLTVFHILCHFGFPWLQKLILANRMPPRN